VFYDLKSALRQLSAEPERKPRATKKTTTPRKKATTSPKRKSTTQRKKTDAS
jgi:hypothetical protein